MYFIYRAPHYSFKCSSKCFTEEGIKNKRQVSTGTTVAIKAQ